MTNNAVTAPAHLTDDLAGSAINFAHEILDAYEEQRSWIVDPDTHPAIRRVATDWAEAGWGTLKPNGPFRDVYRFTVSTKIRDLFNSRLFGILDRAADHQVDAINYLDEAELLVAAGWAEWVPMTHGDDDVLRLTDLGVRVAGIGRTGW
jgi:hypothetical protein